MTDETTIWTWIGETNIQAALIGPLISSLIGGIAYWFHNENAKKIALASLIQDIERLAMHHWCSDPNDNTGRIRCLDLQNLMQTLSWKINKKCISQKDALIEYRQAVTGGEFSESNKPILSHNSPRIILISEKAKNLRKVLGIKKHH